MFTYNTDNYNSYNAITPWKCDPINSAELIKIIITDECGENIMYSGVSVSV